MTRLHFGVWIAALLMCCLSAPGQEKAETHEVQGVSRKVSFIIDVAGLSQDELNVVLEQMGKAVKFLRPEQSFNVIVVQEDNFLVMSNDGLIAATPANKRQFDVFAKQVSKCDRSGVIAALTRGFKDEPDLLFLLTHENFPNNDVVVKRVKQLNAKKQTKVNTILFNPPKDPDALREALKAISRESGGTFKVVQSEDVAQPPPATQPAEKSR